MNTSKNSSSFPSFSKIFTQCFRLPRQHLCGYDLNLTYPQTKPLPQLLPNQRSNTPSVFIGAALTPSRARTNKALRYAIARTSTPLSGLSKRELTSRAEKRAALKRDLSQRANGTIDPWYQCFLLSELIDYAVNFTQPWCTLRDFAQKQYFDVVGTISG